MFYTFGSNLVILTWTSDKLSPGQAHDWRPHGQTQATTIPEGQNWPRVKTHFEWLLWHWSSLGQLNLEPTRPNGLVGCKVPTDLVKISVKEATHMGFIIHTHRHTDSHTQTGSCININMPSYLYRNSYNKEQSWNRRIFISVSLYPQSSGMLKLAGDTLYVHHTSKIVNFSTWAAPCL